MSKAKKLLEIYLISYLVFMSGGYPNEFNSDIFLGFYLVIGALIVSWVVYSATKNKKLFYPPHKYIYGLFILAGMMSLIHSVNYYLSTKEIWFWLVYLFLFMMMINLVGHGWGWRSLLNSAMIVGALFNAFILAEIIYKYSTVERCSRYVHGANHKAAFILIVLIVGLAILLDRDKGRILPCLLVVSSVICLMATGSRGALVAASLGSLLVIVVTAAHRGIKKKISFTLSSTALVIGPPLSILFTRPPAVCKSAWSNSILRRIDLWRHSIDLIARYPLLGSGPETFGYLAAPAFDFAAAATHPHNIYLRILAERGFIGVIAAIALLLVLVKTLLVDIDHIGSKAAGLGLLAAYLIHGLADVAWMDPFVMRYLAIMFGLILAAPNLTRER
jgi:O-antigen ligase